MIAENVLEQDNESAIKLEKNGRMSAGPKSRHMSIRYFWMKDRIANEGIVIRHCPTLQMVCDFFTKPLQGNLFKQFRDAIMGDKHMDTLAVSLPMPTEEHVGSTRQSDNGTSECASHHTSNNTETPVAKARSVSWADVVKGVTNATKRTAERKGVTNTKDLFWETILSKQSNV
jgi:hypothetical protein